MNTSANLLPITFGPAAPILGVGDDVSVQRSFVTAAVPSQRVKDLVLLSCAIATQSIDGYAKFSRRDNLIATFHFTSSH